MSLLKIIELEGLPYKTSELGVFLHHNNILQDIITQIPSENPIILPADGEVKLQIKPMSEGSQVLCSATFALNTLKSEDLWIDLLSESSDIDLKSRLLIQFELNDQSCDLSQEDTSIMGQEEEVEFPRLRLQLKMQTFSIQEMSLELQSTKQKLECETKNRENSEVKLQETLKEYSQFVHMAQSREKSMLKLLEQKDIEIAENINQTLKLQGYLDRLLEDKRHVEEKLACLKTVVSNDETEVLRQQVSQLKAQIGQEDKRRQELQEMLLQIGKEWRETEDQHKINSENRLIKAEQELLRSHALIQDLQLDIQKFQNSEEKTAIEVQILKQELERTLHEKAVTHQEISELSEKTQKTIEKNSELSSEISNLNQKLLIKQEEINKLSETYQKQQEEINHLEKTLKDSTSTIFEEHEKSVKLLEKLQEEKIYNNRLNEQILQERLSTEKSKQETQGPDLDTLIDETFRSLKLENSILKVGDLYFYNGSEVALSKRVDYWVEARPTGSKEPPSTLSTFLLSPKLLDISIQSICSKNNPKKVLTTKTPLRERNSRVGSTSAMRKRPFK
jgi:hypothetical protein